MISLSVPQLVGLLKDKNPVVRHLALQNLLPYTQSGNPRHDVWQTNNWEGARILNILAQDRNVIPLHESVRKLNIEPKNLTTSYCGANKSCLGRGIA